jgi:hypothetical protein
MRILLLLYQGVENGKLQALITEWTATATMTSSSEYTYPGEDRVHLPRSGQSTPTQVRTEYTPTQVRTEYAFPGQDRVRLPRSGQSVPLQVKTE